MYQFTLQVLITCGKILRDESLSNIRHLALNSAHRVNIWWQSRSQVFVHDAIGDSYVRERAVSSEFVLAATKGLEDSRDDLAEATISRSSCSHEKSKAVQMIVHGISLNDRTFHASCGASVWISERQQSDSKAAV